MAGARERRKKPALELFLKKVSKRDLPTRGSTIPRRDPVAHRALELKMDRVERELEEAQLPFFKAQIESIGLTIEDVKKILQKQRRRHVDFQRILGKDSGRYRYNLGPYVGILAPVAVEQPECKEVTFVVCEQKVCVDQPVPVTVDDIWLELGSNGSFSRNGGQFSHSDEVFGDSEWNWTYHRKTSIHEGGINIRSSVELVEPAKVRQIGMTFRPLLDYRGWPLPNGVFASGDNKLGLPDSFGHGMMWSAFQVSIRTPGGTWVRQVPDSNVQVLYKDTGEIYSRIMQENAYPPPRSLDLFRDFPATTQFLVEVSLSYWIRATGVDATASADYNLEVVPYMNLEACSWEYPKWAVVQIP